MSESELKTRTRLAMGELIDRILGSIAPAHSASPARVLDLSELEERILLSASPAMAVAEMADAAMADSMTVETATAENEVVTPSQSASSSSSIQQSDSSVSTDPSQNVSHEIVFLDTSVEDYQQLLDDLWNNDDPSREIEVVLLSSSRDGIDQISEALAGREDLDAVHIVSHGTDAAVKLGSTWLTQDNLAGYVGEIARWGNSLSADADLLFYGCDLAASSDGQDLIDSLATLTGADVAASDDDTGHAIFGADWDLEYATGEIETAIAFSQTTQDSWGHIMNVTVDATSTGTTTGSSLTISHTTTSAADRLMLVGISIGEDSPPSVTSVTYNGTSLTSEGSVQSADGGTVEIFSLVAPTAGTHNVVVTLSGNGDAIAGVMTFAGVDQVSPLGTFASDSGDASSGSVAVSSAAGELVFGVVTVNDLDRNLVPGGGQTERWDLFAGFESNGGGSTEAGAPSVDLSWSWGSTTGWAIGGISIKPTSTPTTTITVNTANDVLDGDADTSSLAALIATPGSDGAISLREAITAANNQSGADTIEFNISGAGPHTINLTSSLPDITDTIIIDGASEPSYVAGAPVIELNGGGTVSDGLFLDSGSDGSTIRGLIINRFTDDGIDVNSGSNIIVGNWIGLDNTGTVDQGNGDEGLEITTASNTIGGTSLADRNVISGNGARGVYLNGVGATDNVVQGNYIGTNATGSAAVGNTSQGIAIVSGASDNTIGGTDAGAGNVISGNLDDGIRIQDSGTTGNVVQGNFIGTNAAGDGDLGNADDGIHIHNGASNNTIGGTTEAARNIISGNDDDGVQLSGTNTSNNVVLGNYVGTDLGGTLSLGNTSNGITLESGATSNTIGGTADGAGNLVAFSGSDGVRVQDITSAGNSILRNSIHSNTDSGIDLVGGTEDAFGVTANDAGDADTGANNLQNSPVLTSAFTNGVDTVAVSGTLNTTANTSLRVEFFSNAGAGNEAETYLGFRNVITDSSGNASFVDSFSTAVADGDSITATATNLATGDTSELSAVQASATALIVDTTADTIDGTTTSVANLLASKGADGKISLREAIIATNNTVGHDGIFLSAATYTLSIAGTSEDFAATGDLNVRDSLSLIGAGAGSTIIDGADLDRIFQTYSGSDYFFQGLTVQNASSAADGGALNAAGTVTIADSVFQDNVTTNGGARGAAIRSNGELFLDTVRFTGNTSGGNAGALYTTGDAFVVNSLFDNNSATGSGGAIWHDGVSPLLELINVTMSGNSATGEGGALYAADDVNLINVTITDNLAGGHGGGFALGAVGPTISVYNSIIAGNTATTADPDFHGTASSQGYNIIGDTSGSAGFGSTGDQLNVDPKLAPLADFGGPTLTHALYSGSPAEDAGDPAFTSLAIDQRSFARDDGSPDIGAFEGTLASNIIYVDTTSDDATGSDTSSISALIANKGADGKISLREAIAAVNNTSNIDGSTPDEIRFAISTSDAGYTDPTPGSRASGDEYWTITPSSFLGNFTDPVILDATTQLGYDSGTGRPVIEIDGSSAVGATAIFVLRTNDSTIKGFALHSSADEALEIDGQTGFGDNNTLHGNWVGLDAEGVAQGNTEHGIAIAFAAQGNLIGGSGTNEGNVIAGNGFSGIFLRDVGTNDNVIQGNLIGVLPDGTTAAANSNHGIELSTNVSGTLVGGTDPGQGNTIASNTLNGISINSDAGTGNSILSNVITSNSQLAIDIGNNGVTLNDSGDPDVGANNLQNFPVLDSAVTDGSTEVDIVGSINTTASETVLIQFFANDANDGTGYGEGQTYLGFTNVTTGADGNATFDVTLSAAVAEGAFISATATSSGGSTSEFALSVAATGSPNTRPYFGENGDGSVTTTIPGSSLDFGFGSVVQTDGKIIVAGSSNIADFDISLVRYHADGSVDQTFGTDGVATLDLGGNELGFDVALQSDGKIVVAGQTDIAADIDLLTVRFNTDGSLDTTFDSDGYAIVDINGDDSAADVAIQSDGKLVVVGTNDGGGHDFSVVRYETTGALDTTFDSDGVFTHDFGGSSFDQATSVALQSDGKIVVGGSSAVQFGLIRLTTAGVLDTTFDTDGKVTTDFGAGSETINSLAIQADGKIVAGGTADLDFALARYNVDGSLDTTFDTDGLQTSDMGATEQAYDIALTATEKIVISGSTNIIGTNDVMVQRYNSDGSIDTTFNTVGTRITVVGGTSENGYSVNALDDGKLLVGGNTSPNGLLLNRYLESGPEDTTFGATTNRLNGNPTFTEGGAAVVLDADVSIFDAELSTSDDFNGTTLTLVRNGGSNSDDVFSPTGNLEFNSGNLVLSSSTIGTYLQLNGTLALSFTTSVTNAQVNEVMRSLAYSNTSGSPPASVLLNWTFSDQNTGDQGTGGALVATGTTVVNITATNDNPEVSNLDGDTLNYSEGDGAVLIEQGADAVVTDVDSADFSGGALTVEIDSGLESDQDVVTIRNQGTGGGQIGTNGSDVTYEGTVIGTFTGGTGITPLSVTFNSNSTPTAVTALVRNITYENTNTETPTEGARSVTFDLTDGDGGATATQNTTVNVAAANSAPTLFKTGNNPTFNEGDDPVAVEGLMGLSDADSADFDTGVLTVDFTANSTANDRLTIHNAGTGAEQIGVSGSDVTYEGITIGSFTGGTDGSTPLVVTFNANSTEASVQLLMRSVTFENVSENPSESTRTVRFVLTDGDGGTSNTITKSVVVSGVTDHEVTVDTTTDVVDGTTTSIDALLADRGSDGFISLREAIIATNNTAGADTINLPTGTLNLTRTGTGEDLASTGDFDILDDVTIVGTGSSTTIIDGNDNDRVFEVLSGTVTFRDLTVQNGIESAGNAGAGLRLASGTTGIIDGVVFSSNEITGGGNNGAAINAVDGSNLIVTNSTFEDNSSANNGGAIKVAGTAVISNTTFSGNTAGNLGGAIRFNGTSLALTNVTISGNSAGSTGGAIYIANGTTTLQNVTVTSNHATTDGGGIFVSGGTVTLANTIVAENTSGGSDVDISGSFTSLSHNLIGDGTGSSGLTNGANNDQVGTSGSPIDPKLAALTDNGGPTETHALLIDSPAIDAGDNSGAPSEDQRDVSRDATADIGAYEFVPTGAAPSDLAATSTSGGGLSLNHDGGNDAYLVADDGGALLGGLTKFTIESQFSIQTPATDETPLFSYATGSAENEIKVSIRSTGELTLSINNSNQSSSSTYLELFDGDRHHVAVVWDSASGNGLFYVDGTPRESFSGFKTGTTIAGSGQLIFGQEQDSLLGGFEAVDVFQGTLYDVRVFDDARFTAEIAASHNTTIAYNEPNLIANWTFSDRSSDGLTTESVAGNNLTVANIGGGGFTSSIPALVFAADENAADNTVVGRINGADTERAALIASLLAADSDLSYDEITGKFYKVNTSATDWTSAQSNAIATTLNGVGGQLATIRSAHEFNTVRSVGQTAGISGGWLGGSDSTVEGQWQWYNGATPADQFADSNGDPIDGAYANFGTFEPSGGVTENHLEFNIGAGDWNDLDGSATRAYFIEWDADSVLDNAGGTGEQPLTYSVVSQTVSGAFAIDSDSGEIAVADGSLLDFETNPTHTLNLRVTDVDGNSYNEAFTVSLNPINEAPVVTLPAGPLSATEGQSLNLHGAGITVGDIDADSGTATATLAVGEGVISVVVGDSGATIDSGDGTNTVVLTGSITDLDNLLSGGSSGTVTYLNDNDTPSASTTLTVTVNDGGNTGADPGLTGDATSEEDSKSVTINLAATNDAPVVTLPGAGVNYTENDPATIIDAGVTVADADSANFDGGEFRVGFAGGTGRSGDALAIRNQGTGSEQIGVSGSDVTYEGTTIGTFTGGASSTPLVVSLNSIATPTAVQALARNVTFENTSDNPSEATRTVRFDALDGDGGDAMNVDTTVDVTAENDAPTITSSGGRASTAIDINDGSTTVTTITSSDPDGGTASYSISGGADSASFNIDSVSGELTLKTAADFASPADATGDGVYEVTVTVSDGAGGTDSQSILATIVAPDVRLFYGQSTDATPQFREFDTIRDILSGEATTSEAGSTIRWSTSVLSPGGTEELVAILSDTGSATELSLLRWDGESWTVDWTATDIDSANSDAQGFSIAYESSSGHAVAVYSNSTANPVYRTWDGSSWSAEADVFATAPGSGTVLWVELASSPISDEITLAYSDSAELHTVVWDGSAWNEAATKKTLEETLAGSGNSRAFDVAYESSGDVVIAWGDGSEVDFETRAAGTTTWIDGLQFPVVNGIITFVDLAADPTSDRVAFAGIDDNAGTERLGLMTWDGSAWQDVGEYDNDFAHVETDGFSEFWAGVGWAGRTGEAVAVYSDADSGVLNWASWTVDSGWTIESDFTVTGAGLLRSVELAGYGNDGVATIFSDENGSLWGLTYEGGSWTILNGGAALETTVSDLKTKPFSLSVERFGGNDASIVDLNGSDTVGNSFSNSFTEGGGRISVTDTDATVSDIDHTTYQALNVNLAGFDDGSDEEVRVNNEQFDFGVSKVITTTVGATTFNLDFDGSGFSIDNDAGGVIPEADLQALVRLFEYENTSLNPTAGNRTLSFQATDASGLASTSSVSTISVSGVNNRPTLTAFADSVDTTLEDTEVEVTFAEIAAQGNESDADGTVTAFVVKSVPTGSLKIGLTVDTATAYSAASNNVIDATNNAYWTPSLNSNGTKNAFTVVARDNLGLESIGNIAVSVEVTPVNDDPTISAIADQTPNEDTATGAIAFTVGDVETAAGSLTVTATSSDQTLVPDGNITLGGSGASRTINVLPGTNETGGPATITVSVFDGDATTQTTFDVTVTAVNDAPVASISLSGYGVNEDDPQRILTGVSVSDIDAGSNDVSVTVSVDDGDLTVTTTTGLTFTAGTNGSSEFTAEGTISELNAALGTLRYQPDPNFNGTDTFTLFVDDLGNSGGAARTSMDSVPITVTAVNDAPLLDLDADDSSLATGNDFNQTFEEGGGPVSLVDDDVTLSDIDSANLSSISVALANRLDPASKEELSADASGTPLSANWDSGTNTLTINGSGTVADYLAVLSTVKYDNTANNPDATTRTITFVANDGTSNSLVATTTLSFSAVNDAPVINSDGGAGTAAVSVAENVAQVTTVTSTDVDGGTPVYSISGGADSTKFSIDSGSGILKFVAAPDFESPTDTDGDNDYEVAVQVSDQNGGFDSQAITVTVTAENDNDPVITSDGGGATFAIDVAENSTAVTTVTATDDDLPAQTLSYSISGGADLTKFHIDSGSGVLTFAFAPDFDSASDTDGDNDYEVTVEVSDGAGRTDSQDITVTVTDLNDTTPVVDGGQSFFVIESATDATSLGTVTATDPDTVGSLQNWTIVSGNTSSAFAIDSTSGELTVNNAAALDFETLPTFTLTVRVSDGANTSANQTVTVNLTNANDAPVVSAPASDSVAVGETLAFSAANGNAITVSDVEESELRIQLSVDDGSLTLSSKTGLVFLAGTGTADAAMTFKGSIDNINAALEGLEFVHGDNHSGICTVTIEATDFSASGPGGPITSTDMVAISVLMPAGPPISGDAFLQGNFLEVGFGEDGILGSQGNAPVGFNSAGAILGVEVDHDRDGFGVGQVDGDFILPGTPEEAFGVSVGGTTTFNSNSSSQAIAGSLSNFQDTGTTQTLDFNGTASGLQIDATHSVGINDQFMDVAVTLTNSTDSALSDVYYFRNVDPDNNFDTSGTFPTTNTIVSQGNDGSAQAYVTATQADGSLLGLLGFGENARVTRGGFSNRDPIAIWDGSGGLSQTGTSTADEAVSLAFKFDSIESGESVTFSYRYVFGETQAPVLDLDPDGSTGAAKNVNVSYAENDGAIVIVDTDATIFDGDSTNLTGLTVQITNDLDSVAESLSADTSGTSIVASAYNSTTGVLSLSGSDTVANYRQVLRTISYTNTSETPDTTTRQINFATTDGTFTSNTVKAFVSVTATNDLPVINSDGGADTATVSVAENSTEVTTVTSTDLDSDSPSYSITGGADSTKFNIDSDSGSLTFAAAPDFENATDSDTDNQYEVTVSVSDGNGGTDSQDISVTVTAVNDNAPQITSNGGGETATIDVAENSTAVTTVAATDADLPAQELDYTISGGADAARFNIDAASGELTFAASPNFEAATDSGSDNTYEVIVRVSDGISFFDLQTITVTVTDVDEFDVSPISDADGGADSVNENASNGVSVGIRASATDDDGTNNTVTYSLDNDSNGEFFIETSAGDVKVAGPIDREAGATRTIVVRATSEDGSFTTKSFTIAIDDVNEFDITAISDSNGEADTVDENAAVGTAVGITASASDDDATSNEITYSLDNDSNGEFAIDSSSGKVNVAGPIDREAGPTRTITVRATSEDGSFTTKDFTIAINDLNDNAPVIDLGQSFDVSEFASNGDSLGTATATDVDTVGTIQSWAITGGNADSVFEIDSASGELRVADNSLLNFETTAMYILSLRVEDGVNTSSMQTVTVNVGNENDVPVLDVNAGISVVEGGDVIINSAVLSVSDEDELAGELRYTIGNAPAAGRLELTSDPGISVSTFTQADIDSNLVRFVHDGSEADDSFTFSISDGSGGTVGSTLFAITNLRVNDAPVNATPTSQTTNEDTPLTFSSGTGNGISVSDVDLNGGLIGIRLVPTNGTLTLGTTSGLVFANGNGSNNSDIIFAGSITDVNNALEGLTFSPTADYNGPATVRIVTRDMGNSGSGGEQIDDDTIHITVTAVNDNPFAADDEYSTSEDNALTVSAANGLLSNDSDIDDDALSAVAVSSTTNGALSLNADGSFVYTPDENFNGIDSFTYRATDGRLQSATRTVTLNVAAVNDASVSVDDEFTIDQLTVLELSAANGVLVNDFDVEADTLQAALVDGPQHGRLVLNADGSLTYTPSATFFGEDTFTYQSVDGSDDGSIATVRIVVRQTITAGGDGEGDIVVEESDTRAGDEESESADVDNSTGIVADDAVDSSVDADPGETSTTLTMVAPTDTSGETSDTTAGVSNDDDDGRSTNGSENEQPTFVTAFRIDERGELRDRVTGRIVEDAGVVVFTSTDVGSMVYVLEQTGFWTELDTFEQDVQASILQEGEWEELVVETTTVAGTTLTVGYIVWLLRSGSVVFGLVSSLPAWTMMDPLPVLQSGLENLGDGDHSDDDSLQGILQAHHDGTESPAESFEN